MFGICVTIVCQTAYITEVVSDIIYACSGVRCGWTADALHCPIDLIICLRPERALLLFQIVGVCSCGFANGSAGSHACDGDCCCCWSVAHLHMGEVTLRRGSEDLGMSVACGERNVWIVCISLSSSALSLGRSRFQIRDSAYTLTTLWCTIKKKWNDGGVCVRFVFVCVHTFCACDPQMSDVSWWWWWWWCAVQE